MINDGIHTYTYDAEGNVLTVDSGNSAQYVYDALNQRIRVQRGTAVSEFRYDYAGRITSTWLNPGNGNGYPGTVSQGRVYWGNRQIASHIILSGTSSRTFFEHQDWTGTERVRTDSSNATADQYFSNPWGDGFSATINNGTGDTDILHFAGLDHDAADNTEHADFRNYSTLQARWLSPDPYNGSYDVTNPQSLNRYTYALNNPLGFVDPTGLEWQSVGGNCYQEVTTWSTEAGGGSSSGTDYGVIACVGGENGPGSWNCQEYGNCPGVPGGPLSGWPGVTNTPTAPGAPPSKPKSPGKGLAGCVGEALSNNAGSLLLDAAGVALTVSPLGPEAKVLGAIALGAASTVVGVVEANTTSTKGVLASAGAFANIFGIQTAPLELAQEFAQFSRGAGKLLTGVGIGADLASVGLDVKSCLGQPQ